MVPKCDITTAALFSWALSHARWPGIQGVLF